MGRFGGDASVEDIMRSYGVDQSLFKTQDLSPTEKQNVMYVLSTGILVIYSRNNWD